MRTRLNRKPILILILAGILTILLCSCSFTAIKTPVVLTQIVVIPRGEDADTIAENPIATPASVLPLSPTPEPVLLNTATADQNTSAPAVPTLTSTIPPGNFFELRLIFWDVGVLYDEARWQLGGHDHMPSITHRQVSNCVIYEQGPTEHPQMDGTITLGKVEYQIAALMLSGRHVDWYMGIRNADGRFQGGMPTLIVRSAPAQRDDCLAQAEIVLASMARQPFGAAGSPSSGSTATGKCPGAPPQQVGLGDEAYVCTKADHVVLREKPNRGGEMVRYLAPGDTMTVIGGPSCADSWSWWQVRTEKDAFGWIAEGGDRIDPYFICPK